jgi:ketosteroid isomerase-like protein
VTSVGLDSVADRLAIQELVARYSLAIDSRDLEALARLYHPNCPVRGYPNGPDGVRRRFDAVLRTFAASTHFNGNHVLSSLDPDAASGSLYCLATHLVADDARWVTMQMLYQDQYTRHDGRWVFWRRAVHAWRSFDAPPTVDAKAILPYSAPNDLPELWPSWIAFWSQAT